MISSRNIPYKVDFPGTVESSILLLRYLSNPAKYTNLKGFGAIAITTTKLLGLQTKCVYLAN